MPLVRRLNVETCMALMMVKVPIMLHRAANHGFSCPMCAEAKVAEIA